MKHYVLQPLSVKVSRNEATIKSRSIVIGASPLNLLLSSRKTGYLEKRDLYDDTDDDDDEIELVELPDVSGKSV